jgi:hypothetical protein
MPRHSKNASIMEDRIVELQLVSINKVHASSGGGYQGIEMG